MGENVRGGDKKAREREAIRMAKVQEILRRWDPIGVYPGEFGPADEYDSYAPHIVSLVVQRCSRDDLARHLETVRTEMIGLGPNPTLDREIASEILEALRDEPV